jgi:hypothetical protein
MVCDGRSESELLCAVSGEYLWWGAPQSRSADLEELWTLRGTFVHELLRVWKMYPGGSELRAKTDVHEEVKINYVQIYA